MEYSVIISDPPWSYYGQQDKWGAAAKFYETIPDGLMETIAWPPLAKPGILFMWTTSAKLDLTLELFENWGLYYRGIAFVWIKTRHNGEPIGAQGVRPSITKPLTEFVACASNVAKGRPLKLHDEGISQTIFSPKRDHSRKPDEVMERIESMYPNESKLEMFARAPRPGWEGHGDELVSNAT